MRSPLTLPLFYKRSPQMNKTNMYMLLETKKIRERQKAKEEAEKRKEKEEFNRVEEEKRRKEEERKDVERKLYVTGNVQQS